MANLILEFTAVAGSDLTAVPAAAVLLQRSRVTVVRIPAGRIGGQWGMFGRKRDGIEFLPCKRPAPPVRR